MKEENNLPMILPLRGERFHVLAFVCISSQTSIVFYLHVYIHIGIISFISCRLSLIYHVYIPML